MTNQQTKVVNVLKATFAYDTLEILDYGRVHVFMERISPNYKLRECNHFVVGVRGRLSIRLQQFNRIV